MDLDDDVDIIESLQETADTLEAAHAETFLTGDVEDKTIDESFLKKITETYDEDNTETGNVDTMYYQEGGDNLEAQYLQESSDAMENFGDASNDASLVLNQDDSTVSSLADGQLIQLGATSDASAIKSATFATAKSDVLQMPQQVRVIKRPVLTPSGKNVTSKVYIKQTPKGPVVQRNILTTAGAAQQEIPLHQAKKLGLITPKMSQTLLKMGSPRLVMKSLSSSPLQRGPTKILPAPLQKVTTVRTTMPATMVRANVGQNPSRTILASGSATTVRPITVTKSVAGVVGTPKTDLSKVPQKLIVRPGSVQSGGLKMPIQLSGKQPIQLVKLVNSPGGFSFAAVRPKVVQASGHILMSTSADGKKTPVPLKTSTPLGFKGKTYTAIKATPGGKFVKPPQIVTLDDNEASDDPVAKTEPLDVILDADPRDAEATSPHEILEANGIRPKKPCNCTRSQCLKLYCECFANGEFCFQCNCNNCFNNIEHEEERQQSIKSCLDRNPAAFQPKIQMADSDEEERRHNKGCNCRRSHCLKNYCECFEAKLTCSKYCKCASCRNTEEDLAAWEQGERTESGDEDAAVKPSPYLPQNVAQALCDCILVQAEECERKGEDMVTTEKKIIEELGQRLVQLIGNRSKKDSR